MSYRTFVGSEAVPHSFTAWHLKHGAPCQMRNCDIIVGASPNPPKPAETQLVWTSNLGPMGVPTRQLATRYPSTAHDSRLPIHLRPRNVMRPSTPSRRPQTTPSADATRRPSTLLSGESPSLLRTAPPRTPSTVFSHDTTGQDLELPAAKEVARDLTRRLRSEHKLRRKAEARLSRLRSVESSLPPTPPPNPFFIAMGRLDGTVRSGSFPRSSSDVTRHNFKAMR